MEQAATLLAEMKEMAKGNATALAMLDDKEQELISILINSNPISWTTVEKHYLSEVNDWIGQAERESDRAKGYITQENESSDAPILLDALVSVIGNIDMRFTIAVEVLKGVAALMESEPSGSLTEFHTSWIKSLRKQKPHFGEFKEYIYRTLYGLDYQGMLDPNIFSTPLPTQDQIIEKITPYIAGRVLPAGAFQKLYVDIWLKSTKDKDTGFFATKDNDAGYICINMRYICPAVTIFNMDDLIENGIWKLKKAYVDDVERPKGTKEALLSTYGNISLVDLPYKIILKIDSEGAQGGVGINLPIHDQVFHKTTEGKWKRKRGDERLFLNWFRKQSQKIKLKDLGVE